MSTRVWRACFQAGSRNAGTPLEMASTPVTAEPPEANALAQDVGAGAHVEAGVPGGVAELDGALAVAR